MATGALFFTDTTTALGGSATFTGTGRDAYGVGTGAGVSEFVFFNATFNTDQTGTAYIDYSTDNATWSVSRTAALAANTPLALTTPIQAQFYRVRVVNGATPQTTLVVRSGFTVA